MLESDAVSRHVPLRAGPNSMDLPPKYGLWSLFDMRRFFAASFCTAFLQLEFLQGASLFDELDGEAEARWRRDVADKLQAFAKECTDAGFDDLARRCERLVPQADHLPVITLCHMLRDILPAIQFEIAKHMYFLVPSDRRHLYREGDEPLFGEAVSMVFSRSIPEIAEAGRCFALARWTACVFHLMRGAEQALRTWVVDVLEAGDGADLDLANWQEIINRANAHLRRLGQQHRTQERQEALQFCGEVLTTFLGFKEAWRNHVAHGHRTYTEQEAAAIWGQVERFMTALANRLQGDDTNA